MDAAKLAILLGRPLTPIEIANVELYLEIANDALESLICTPIAKADDETRVFDIRENYRTAFIDIFRSVSEVKVDGTVIDPSDYSLRQWNKRTATWYNSLVFDERFDCEDHEIEVTGDFGFDDTAIPADLQVVLAGLFDLITKKNKFDATISRKDVEDFSVTFKGDIDLDTAFYDKYASTIRKYALCDIPNVQHGKTGSRWT